MAADEQRTSTRWKGRRKAIFLVVEEDKRMYRRGITTYLLYNINIKDMFTQDDDDGEWAVLRPLPCPVAELETLPPLALEYLYFAVVAPNIILGVSNRKRTVLCDATAGDVSPGPELPVEIHGGTVLIPLGTGVYAIGNRPCRTSPTFQLLLPPSRVSGGGRRRRWSWRTLPTPPRELCGGTLRAWLGAGAHIWVTERNTGTYSFDTHGVAWRKEGDWELPIEGRGVFVPDLGLCFGLCPRLRCLCAFDLPATAAPVVRYVWPATFPDELNDMGCVLVTPGSLAYLGHGNLCIAWTMGIEHNQHHVATRFALLLIAVQLATRPSDGHKEDELCLVSRKLRCYDMPANGEDAYLLPT
uniref:DUF1618 domain-containing protein n=1 Tax=Oryza punctata TaxID=4537 RepID=A0A0E0K7A8_ORYPU